ncbi:MAG: FtsX-like permease family protein [Gammaproteobacteria bacterium]|nr:FtsX-like permease family protein [Gammaproteobacteria bacterium]
MIDILKIAVRNLLRYKRRTLLTALLITVGLTAVLLFVAVAGSFKAMMVAQFTDAMVGHLQVHRIGYVGAMESLPVDRNMRPRMLVHLYQALDERDEIAAWSPRVKFMAMFSNFAATTSIRLNGVYPAREIATTPLVSNRVLEGGSAEPLVKPGHIQVPELIAKGMKTKVGDTIVLVATNKDGSVNGKTFVVQGIMESISGPGGRDGYIHIDDARDLLRIPLQAVERAVLVEQGYLQALPERPKAALKRKKDDAVTPAPPSQTEQQEAMAPTLALFEEKGWGVPSEVSEIAVRLHDPGRLEGTLAALQGRLAGIKNRRGKSIFHLHPWQRFVPFSKIADMIDLMTLFIRIILISVVLISIMNVLIMAVYERIREIGTISAIGTRPGTILSLFLSEGLMIGLIGTLLGTAISLAAIWALHATTITFSFGRQENLILAPTISSGDVVMTGLMTILVAVLASLQPAWKASRMDPIKALRHV